MKRIVPESRPEADPNDVARWCEAVRTVSADELGRFERQTRRAYQHHSLIDLIRAIAARSSSAKGGSASSPPTKNQRAGF
jgi:hypothetical protein